MNTLQAEFEAWAKTVFKARDIEPDEFGGYTGENVHGAWEGWQAATERAAKLAEDAAEGEWLFGDKKSEAVCEQIAAAIRAGGEKT